MNPDRLLHSRILLIVLLAVAAVLIYGSSLRNSFVVWDDDSLVYQNPLTQEMTAKTVFGAFTSYDPELYVPLTIVSFQLEHAVFGFEPFFFHLDNLLLHVLGAFLVFLLLQKLGLRRSTSMLGSLLFLVHPINTEAVAWVSARKDLLSSVFTLLALLMYRYNGTGRNGITMLFFVLALFSKPVAIILPLALLIIDWKEQGRITQHTILKKWPFFLLSAIFLIIGLYGKQRNIGALTVMQTFLLAAKSTALSVHTFFWPTALSPIYLQTNPISITQGEFLIPLFLVTATALIILLSLRKTRVIAFAALFYFLFLLPSFSNFAKDQDVYFFSDRYIYVSQIGLLFILGYGIDRLARRNWQWICTAPLVVLFAWQAHAQSLHWKDSETLYRDALAKNDQSVVMHYNLAVLEHRRGNRSAALEEYTAALSIDPQYAKALSNLGILYKEDGNVEKAMKEFRSAAESDPRSPEPHNNIGSVLMDQGNVDGAIAEFRKAITLSERFAQAHINLAAALGRKGLYAEGLREYKRAFELAPQLLDGLPQIKRALEST